MMRRCYIFDLDYVLADPSHREQYADGPNKNLGVYYDLCAGDAPIKHMVEMARTLSFHPGVIFNSSRRERCREDTVGWLDRLGLFPVDFSQRLYLRDDNARGVAWAEKVERLDQIRADGWEPIMAFDDDENAAFAYVRAGVPCVQVIRRERRL